MQRTHSDILRVERLVRFTTGLLAATLLALPAAAQEAPTQAESPAMTVTPQASSTLDHMRATGRIRFGYLADAKPFSYRDESGKASGYTVALCQHVADAAKAELGLASLAVDWEPVTADTRFVALQMGKVDLLCGAETATLARRRIVDFSIPVFLDGIGALLRSDASARLREVLSEGPPTQRPLWRGSAMVLQQRRFAVVAGTTSEGWLKERLDTFGVSATITPVADFEAGAQAVRDGRADVLFGDRAVLLEIARRAPNAGALLVLDRRFSWEPLALALTRGDNDFRLLVDASLSRQYTSEEFRELYTQWFGAPDQNALTFFRTSHLPE